MLSKVDTSSVVSITISDPTSQRTRKIKLSVVQRKKKFLSEAQRKNGFQVWDTVKPSNDSNK